MLSFYLAATLTLEKLPVHLRLAPVFIKLIHCVVLADTYTDLLVCIEL